MRKLTNIFDFELLIIFGLCLLNTYVHMVVIVPLVNLYLPTAGIELTSISRLAWVVGNWLNHSILPLSIFYIAVLLVGLRDKFRQISRSIFFAALLISSIIVFTVTIPIVSLAL